LESLDREDYEIIYLRFFDNMSEALIAFILDIPEGTVKSRLFNVKRKLKELMESGRKN
jgi:RNA polymerase sigma-70 factor (ECF subfamily)